MRPSTCVNLQVLCHVNRRVTSGLNGPFPVGQDVRTFKDLCARYRPPFAYRELRALVHLLWRLERIAFRGVRLRTLYLHLPRIRRLIRRVGRSINIRFRNLRVVPSIVQGEAKDRCVLRQALCRYGQYACLVHRVHRRICLHDVRLPLLFPLGLIRDLLVLLPNLFSRVSSCDDR